MLKPHWTRLLAGCIITLMSFSVRAQSNNCPLTGPQNLLVIVADYKGALTAAPSINYLKELFRAAPTEPSVSDYLARVSGGVTTVNQLNFLGPYHAAHVVEHDSQSPRNVLSTLDDWKHEIVAMAAHDIDISTYNRIILFSPPPLDSRTGVEYQVGGGNASNFCDFVADTNKGKVNFAQAWIRADRRYLGYTPQQLSTRWDKLTPAQRTSLIQTRKVADMQPITHEIGHTFGLGHANRIARPSVFKPVFFHDEILPDTDVKLYQISYGDLFSVMSSSSMGWLSVPHLSVLGWLPPGALAEVRRPGTFRLYPLEGSGAVLKGLKIPRLKSMTDKTNAYLWVEFRQPQTFYENQNPLNQMNTDGPLVYYTNPDQPNPQGWSYPNETIKLHFVKPGTVEAAFETDFTLKGLWHDAHSLVSIRTLNVTTQFVEVQVDFSK